MRYDQGDALALPYPDEHFDGVRCERVLQHVTDPDAAIAEMGAGAASRRPGVPDRHRLTRHASAFSRPRPHT
ncbi:methyltransferase domain-containing protein [Micromonospora sp. NPDC048898]|uniref:methyltransferase domain-containing protein n=1 Tax=Micromonospora sp. NPDC048898 TaxID=3364260 RepID=UPI00371F387F